ncbi:MAG: PKD domain-containing protein [Candidatus Thermoplasmatota archaeon]|nr:PKD domain-containing protein [Candidatus Thermoplasmatota archaeon]
MRRWDSATRKGRYDGLFIGYLTMSLLTLSLVLAIPEHSGRVQAQGQDDGTITCGPGTTPVLDGENGTREWSDAREIVLLSRSGEPFSMFYKHDGSSLNICFMTFGNQYAEVYLDTEDDSGYRPKNDDVLLHISSALYECQGTGLRWGDSLYDVEGWDANTMTEGIGRLELSISVSKLGATLEDIGTLGIGLKVTTVNGSRETDHRWPQWSNEDDPGSWGDMTFLMEGGGDENIPPRAEAKADRTKGDAPLVVSFTGRGEDIDGTIVSYGWGFDDGSSSTDKDPVHTFMSPGSYQVLLTVTDNVGGIGKDEVNITVKAPSGTDDDGNGQGDDGGEDDNVPDVGVEEASGMGVPIVVLTTSITVLALARKRIKRY